MGPLAASVCLFTWGLALLSFLPARSIRIMPRCERLAAALLGGMFAGAYVGLLLLFCGLRLQGYWAPALGAAGAAILLLRRGRLRGMLGPPEMPEPACGVGPPPIVAALSLLGTAFLAAWMIGAAALLPALDYDSLAIWSYRVKVLLRERSIYSPSLLDPLRFNPMPKHPYLLPVLEAFYMFPGGVYSYTAAHVPHALGYVAHCAFGLALLLSSGRRPRIWIAAIALLTMPAVAAAFSIESPREPLIGILGGFAAWFLIRWANGFRFEFLLMAAGFAFAAQQTKIEGMPLLLGLLPGAALIAAGSQSERRAAFKQVALVCILAVLLAAPWYLFRKAMPASAHGYDFSTGFGSDFGARVRALPRIARMTLSEAFLRPELYGLAGYAVLAGLVRGWSRRNWMERIGLLISPAMCCAAVLAIYTVRQGQLPPERNVTLSRRFMCFVPALVLASLAYPDRRRERPPEHLNQ